MPPMSSLAYVTPLLELFPLDDAPESTLKCVCQAIWKWQKCQHCGTDGTSTCVEHACPWKRRPLLGHFLTFYKQVTSWNCPEQLYRSLPALRNHDDLLDIVRLIRDRPNVPKRTLMEEHFLRYDEAPPDKIDQLRAFDLAIRVLTMVRCSSGNSFLVHWKPFLKPVVWRPSDSALGFMATAIAKGKPVRLNDETLSLALSDMTVDCLETTHSLELVGTDDIRMHLLLDGKAGVLYIYHYAAFLKEYLKMTGDDDSRAVEIFPRQLALETLHSIHFILFPFYEASSRRLVKAKGWDTECVGADFMSYCREDEDEVHYHYWGRRCLALAERIGRPMPAKRGRFWEWLSKRSGAEYIMLVTAIGVALGALLGLGALVVGAFQIRSGD